MNAQPEDVTETDDEEIAVAEIIAIFQASLLDPENQDHVREFHFGCLEDSIVWDDSPFAPTYSGNPVIAVSVDVSEMSSGVFDQITPRGLHGIMFRGEYGVDIYNHLKIALLCERRNLRNGYAERDYPEIMRTLLKAILVEMFKSCRDAIANDPAYRPEPA